MLVRATALTERLRGSLFVVPMAFVLLGAVVAVIGIEVDQRLVESPGQLPFVLTSTVDSARAVLGTIASATITVAGIAFSISLLVIQLASSQYSPRIVHGLLRDPFSKRVMGTVAGTFTYCLVVLRAVRGPLEENGTPVIPNVSVALAVLLGIASILAIVSFIDHSAHWMDVSRILARATDDAVSAVRDLWGEPGPVVPSGPLTTPPDDHLLVTHDRSGWIQHVDLDALVGAADEGGTVRMETEVGRYAIPGTPLCRIWPAPDDVEAACDQARSALVTGTSRTSQQDVGYGVRQLADVALRALSPGINDPTTAQDAMFHATTVLGELLDRQPAPLVTARAGSRILQRPERLDHEAVIELAFGEVRRAAAAMPTVAIYLLEILSLLDQRAGGEEAHAALREQARLIRDAAATGDLLPEDVQRIEAAHDDRFGTAT